VCGICFEELDQRLSLVSPSSSSSSTETASEITDQYGRTALLLAADSGENPMALNTAQWLLAEGGSSITEADQYGMTVWHKLEYNMRHLEDDSLSSLLKVMVLLGGAPSMFKKCLKPLHAQIFARGQQLRELLPAYLEQQRLLLVTHSSLPTVLQPLILAYAVPTQEDMWDGWLSWLPEQEVPSPHAVILTHRYQTLSLSPT
jgi:hypothetical protein